MSHLESFLKDGIRVPYDFKHYGQKIVDALLDTGTLPTKRLREPTIEEYFECALVYHTQNDKSKSLDDICYLP